MIKSRYATKKVNNNFYTTIDIKKPLNWVVSFYTLNIPGSFDESKKRPTFTTIG
jgi:hypothetical protein